MYGRKKDNENEKATVEISGFRMRKESLEKLIPIGNIGNIECTREREILIKLPKSLYKWITEQVL